MVTEGDCSCTDTTEPSNITSLHSDDINSARNPGAHLCAKTNGNGNDAAEESKGTRSLSVLKLYRLSGNRPSHCKLGN